MRRYWVIAVPMFAGGAGFFGSLLRQGLIHSGEVAGLTGCITAAVCLFFQQIGRAMDA